MNVSRMVMQSSRIRIAIVGGLRGRMCLLRVRLSTEKRELLELDYDLACT